MSCHKIWVPFSNTDNYGSFRTVWKSFAFDAAQSDFGDTHLFQVFCLAYLSQVWQKTCLPGLGNALPAQIIEGEKLIDLSNNSDGRQVSAVQVEVLDLPVDADIFYGDHEVLHYGWCSFVVLGEPSRDLQIDDVQTPGQHPWGASFGATLNIGANPYGNGGIIDLTGRLSGGDSAPSGNVKLLLSLDGTEVYPNSTWKVFNKYVTLASTYSVTLSGPPRRIQSQPTIRLGTTQVEGKPVLGYLRYLNHKSHIFYPESPGMSGFWIKPKPGVKLAVRLYMQDNNIGVISDVVKTINPMKLDEGWLPKECAAIG